MLKQFSISRWAFFFFLTLVLTLSGRSVSAAPKVKKKPLDHSSYERWSRISQQSLSNDGKWILYTTSPNKGSSVVRLLEIKTGRQYVLQNSRSAKFSFDGKQLAYLTTPKPVPSKKSSTTKTPPKKTTTKKPAPKTSLIIMDLATGRRQTIVGVKSYAMPTKAAGSIAYILQQSTPEPIEKPGK